MNDSGRVLIKLYSQKQVGQVRPVGRGLPPPSPAQVALIFPVHWNHLLSFETLSQATPQANRISLRLRTWASVVLKLDLAQPLCFQMRKRPPQSRVREMPGLGGRPPGPSSLTHASTRRTLPTAQGVWRTKICSPQRPPSLVA